MKFPDVFSAASSLEMTVNRYILSPLSHIFHFCRFLYGANAWSSFNVLSDYHIFLSFYLEKNLKSKMP